MEIINRKDMKKKTCRKPLELVRVDYETRKKREWEYGNFAEICMALDCDIADNMEMITD